ncbi:uncharacterized protein LOC142414992 [Mycteria americana]|uniref:uncharacterized protein LOC142414992 n=1 Tax=Mycteria americana TaxID=33587 RepID=UPI003F58783F
MREDGLRGGGEAGRGRQGAARLTHAPCVPRRCGHAPVSPGPLTHGTEPGEAPQAASETLRGARGTGPAGTGRGAALPGPGDPGNSAGRVWRQCAGAKTEAANRGRCAATRDRVRHAPCSRRRAGDVATGSAALRLPAGDWSAGQRCRGPGRAGELSPDGPLRGNPTDGNRLGEHLSAPSARVQSWLQRLRYNGRRGSPGDRLRATALGAETSRGMDLPLARPSVASGSSPQGVCHLLNKEDGTAYPQQT